MVDLADPVWVVGAPRSGTTYLVEVINHHPGIFVTDETRIMTYVNRALRRWPHESMALNHHKDEVVTGLWRAMPDLVHDVFDAVGRPAGVRWGDKNPHYADSAIDPDLLDTVEALFPTGQYVHLVRDGRDAAASMLKKGWVGRDEAVDTWNRHVRTARSFGYRIGLDRYLEVSYERLVDDGLAVAGELLAFLGLQMHEDVADFLARQAIRRTPFSQPISRGADIGASTWRDRIEPSAHLALERGLADLLVEFGYENYRWRRNLYAPTVLRSPDRGHPPSRARTN